MKLYKKFIEAYILKTLFLLCFLFLVFFYISAQTSKIQLGVQGGLNYSTAFVNTADKTKFKPGYHIGGTVDYLFTRKFELQSGLFLSQQGSIINNLNNTLRFVLSPYKELTYTFNQLYLKMPIYIAYNKTISNNYNLSVGFGPYLGYGIGGKINMKIIYYDINDINTYIWDTFGNGIYDENYYSEHINKFDFGAGLRIDIHYKKYSLGAGCETSIIDIMNCINFPYIQYRNFNILISAGYKF